MPSTPLPRAPRTAPPALSATAPLFIVFNLGSGAGDAERARAVIEQACAEASRQCTLLNVDDPRRLAALARDAVQRAQAAQGVVVAAGGDGTINAVAQAVLGLGLYPKLLEDREGWKKRFGRSRLVAFGAGLATLLRGQRSLRLQIDVHGQTHEVRTPTLFVGNNALQLEQLGFAEAQAIDRGALAAIVLRHVGRWSMLWLLLRGAFGNLGEAEQVLNFAFVRLGLRSARPFGARRIKVATDGEIVWLPLPLQFRVSPEPLWLIRPSAPAPERATA